MNYDTLLSRVGVGMQQSAIRQMGTVAAQNPDIISFAPGYPAPENFAWDEYQGDRRRRSSARDRATLQVRPHARPARVARGDCAASWPAAASRAPWTR